MVKIRLARAGAKKRPFYHLVAADSRSPRDGRFIERLGFFNPVAVGGELRLRVNTGRVDHWVARGARLTERAAKLVGEARLQPAPIPEPEDAATESSEPAAASDAAPGARAEESADPEDGTDGNSGTPGASSEAS